MTRATARDGFGALVLTVVAVVELVVRSDVVEPLAAVQVVVVCAALAGRRAAPAPAVVVAATGMLISPAMHQPTVPTADNIVTPASVFTTYAILVLTYSVAAHEQRRDIAVAAGLLLLGALWAGDLMKGSLPNELLASLVVAAWPGPGDGWSAPRAGRRCCCARPTPSWYSSAPAPRSPRRRQSATASPATCTTSSPTR